MYAKILFSISKHHFNSLTDVSSKNYLFVAVRLLTRSTDSQPIDSIGQLCSCWGCFWVSAADGDASTMFPAQVARHAPYLPKPAVRNVFFPQEFLPFARFSKALYQVMVVS
jgi:hypothetical protein